MINKTSYLSNLLNLLIISTFFFLLACKKQETTSNVNPTLISFDNFKFSGIFNGSLLSSGSTSSIEGYITIDDANKVTLELLSGTMKGTAIITSTNYNITINQVTGFFQNITKITGTLEIASRSLNLKGTDIDGSQITVIGTTPSVLTTGGWENLSKSSVYFTHNKSCNASITINGQTLSGLNSHYAPGGLCSSTYNLWNTIRANVDNKQSKIFCSSGILRGLNGQSVQFTDCSTAGFILNKSTSYNYSVKWDNGETSTGTFTSPSGGGQLAICISNSGPQCSYTLNGKWLDSEGTGTTISGLTGAFYAFSSNWQLFVNNGTVSLGSLKIRNISQINSTTWSCQALFLRIVNGLPVSVGWSTDGSIKMSTNGNTITVTATSPFSGNSTSSIHTRVL